MSSVPKDFKVCLLHSIGSWILYILNTFSHLQFVLKLYIVDGVVGQSLGISLVFIRKRKGEGKTHNCNRVRDTYPK